MSSVEHDAADKVKHATFCPTQPDTVLRAAQPNDDFTVWDDSMDRTTTFPSVTTGTTTGKFIHTIKNLLAKKAGEAKQKGHIVISQVINRLTISKQPKAPNSTEQNDVDTDVLCGATGQPEALLQETDPLDLHQQ
ncbi:uncharacterized protein LOC111244807 isoform X2 [Varroa destructor]|uniref:Uncharacterized protein n=1 Tax=Varroa destructor TaxID=109461 RepID=A0A7M7J7Q0_VARDE|nr:uncharacterized protein LOC111244807 isoform X2 [Varroa destructor]